MKRIFTLIIGVLISASFAQAAPFEKGSNVIGLGVGFGGGFGLSSYDSQTPLLSLHYEHGLWQAGDVGVISLGGYIGYRSAKWGYTDFYYDSNLDPVYYNVSYKWTYTIIGVRSAFHWTGLNHENWDLYAGLMLTNSFVSFSYDSPYAGFVNTNDYGSVFDINGFAGAKYYFTPNFAAFAEGGFGIAALNVGIALGF